MRDSWIVEPPDAGVRLDKFLASEGRLGSRSRAAAALGRGKVFLNDSEIGADSAAVRLSPGDTVGVWMDRPGSAHRRPVRGPRPGELSIVYEDDALVVVDKPPGLLSVPLPRRRDAPSVEEMLGHQLRSRRGRRPLVVHRIDRDTSGLVLFATRPDAQDRLKDQFRRHSAERVYLAVVYGVPAPEQGVWVDALVWDEDELIQKQTHGHDPRGRPAKSHYRVVESFGTAASLIEVSLVTGRRNQIRLQARLRGHTLVGEQRYVYGPQSIRNIDFERQALHAARLGILHPLSGRPMRFETPMPADMDQLVQRLRAEKDAR
ncbi:MAG: RluA family pseudouridine synthase [Vicinamibacterales bacterium]